MASAPGSTVAVTTGSRRRRAGQQRGPAGRGVGDGQELERLAQRVGQELAVARAQAPAAEQAQRPAAGAALGGQGVAGVADRVRDALEGGPQQGAAVVLEPEPDPRRPGVGVEDRRALAA